MSFGIIAIGYDNMVLTKVIDEIWEHGDITAMKSDGKKQKSYW